MFKIIFIYLYQKYNLHFQLYHNNYKDILVSEITSNIQIIGTRIIRYFIYTFI